MPVWDDDTISYVYDKNEGYCWHCGKKLAFVNYGERWARGGWEIDHSVPVARGGTHRRNNLVPACIECNRSKQDLNSREFESILAE